MGEFDNISTSELFKDFQESVTDILLFELLDEESKSSEQIDRRADNMEIIITIISIMTKRFSNDDILKYLNDGYPRQVIL